MLWRIDGSDKETGADRLLFVEADSRDAAIASEGAVGLMVFACAEASEKEATGVRKKKLAAQKTLPLGPVDRSIPVGSPPLVSRASEADAEITSLAKSLRFVGGLIQVLGAFLLLIAAVLIVMAVVGDGSSRFAVGVAGASGIFWGVLFFAGGVALQMLGAIGIVLRDIRRK